MTRSVKRERCIKGSKGGTGRTSSINVRRITLYLETVGDLGHSTSIDWGEDTKGGVKRVGFVKEVERIAHGRKRGKAPKLTTR